MKRYMTLWFSWRTFHTGNMLSWNSTSGLHGFLPCFVVPSVPTRIYFVSGFHASCTGTCLHLESIFLLPLEPSGGLTTKRFLELLGQLLNDAVALHVVHMLIQGLAGNLPQGVHVHTAHPNGKNFNPKSSCPGRDILHTILGTPICYYNSYLRKRGNTQLDCTGCLFSLIGEHMVCTQNVPDSVRQVSHFTGHQDSIPGWPRQCSL